MIRFKSFLKRIYTNKFALPGFIFICALLTLAALTIPLALRPSLYQLSVGDVSQQDIQAPISITYVSSFLTEQAKTEAANAVLPVYLQADPAIARKRIEQLRVALIFINIIRDDEYATGENKQQDLLELKEIRLSPEFASEILALSAARWETVQQESLRVLEQVMRSSIREDRVEDARRQIPTLISFSLPEDQALVVEQIVTPFVVPNSLLSSEMTAAAKQTAVESVIPVKRSYSAGEIIIRRGQIINDVTWEALQQFGLIQPASQKRDLPAAIALVMVVTVFVTLYSQRRHVTTFSNPRSLLIITGLFFLFLLSSKFITTNRTVLPYVFPISAFALTIASLYRMELGLIFSLILSVLVGYGMQHGLELTIYSIFTSMCGLLVLDKGRRVSSFLWAGLAIGLTGSAVIIAYRLPEAITDWIGIVTLCGAAIVNGLASATLTLIFHLFFSQFFGVTSSLQLLELSRPDHPLLQYILRNAPGTYQHSLQVANLAEQAAETIGADSLLVRVGAIYHDVGKAVNPLFFVENQVPGKIDSHDDILPEISAATIIKHVPDGVQLGRKYRLPNRLLDFMREHHGTLLTRYQYTRAVQSMNSPDLVDKKLFQYPGPRPQSKETALLMLADGCEARARAELPKGETELRTVITKVFDYLRQEGQLDDTALTQKDLQAIMNSFVNTLRNTYHPRIVYPEMHTSKSPQKDEPTVAQG